MTTATPSHPLDPTLAHRWHRYRRVLLVAAVVVLTAVLFGVLASQQQRGFLDPEGVDSTGARAVVRLLEAEGVSVTSVRSSAEVVQHAGAGTTVMVTVPDLLQPTQVDQIASTGADLVLVAPVTTTAEFVAGVTAGPSTEPGERDPDCDLAEAERAGSARLGGVVYSAGADATSCYPDSGEPTLVAATEGDARRIVLGTADPLTNEYLDEAGNAALVLGLLGHHRELVWYRPTLGEPEAAEPTPLTDMLPSWVVPMVWQLGIAVLVVAWWRGRRLGRVVTEPLPVVVRSTETSEGRARLYRRGGARGHAAATLREAVAHRLRARLGLPPETSSAALAAVVAERTGRTPGEVVELISGEEPPDDAALVRLTDALDALEQEVHTR